MKVLNKSLFIFIVLLIVTILAMNTLWIYKLGNGLKITEISKSDIEVIKNNIDFSLSESTNFVSAEYCNNLKESSFYLVFYIPEEQVSVFTKPLEGNYLKKDNIFSSSEDEIVINGKSYRPISSFVNKELSFTAIQAYASIDGNLYYRLILDRPNQNISEYFRKKFNIGWINLLT